MQLQLHFIQLTWPLQSCKCRLGKSQGSLRFFGVETAGLWLVECLWEVWSEPVIGPEPPHPPGQNGPRKASLCVRWWEAGGGTVFLSQNRFSTWRLQHPHQVLRYCCFLLLNQLQRVSKRGFWLSYTTKSGRWRGTRTVCLSNHFHGKTLTLADIHDSNVCQLQNSIIFIISWIIIRLCAILLWIPKETLTRER